MNTICSRAVRAVLSATLLVAAGLASATTTVGLTAQRSQSVLPDGTTARMWQFCAPTPAAAASGAGTASGGVCDANKWSPGPTIVVPAGDDLTINLSNQLPVPTSIVILGQLGGGLGTPVRMAQPIVHQGATQTTFPAAGPADAAMTPPAQVARVQSFATEVGANSNGSLKWTKLKPGTYLYETGTLPSIQVPMGLYGVIVVTQAPVLNGSVLTPGRAYPLAAATSASAPDAGRPYDADLTLLFSEIDAAQNAAVDAAALAGTSVTMRFDDPQCAGKCYPAAVNYAPTYFLINGQPFDATHPELSSFATGTDGRTVGANLAGGNVLLRLANAGSRLHVPAAVGLPFTLIAEDGNLAPGLPKVQNEVALPAGKTQDVIVKPATAGGAYTATSIAVYDRQLSTATSGGSGGMQAFVQVNGATTPTAVASKLVDDAFKVPFNTQINGNVKLNDIGAAAVSVAKVPDHGTVTLGPDGNFIYVPTAGYSGSDTFTYTASNTGASFATVSLTVGQQMAAPIAVADTFTSSVFTQYRSAAPGLLANDTDGAGNRDGTLRVDLTSVNPNACGTNSVSVGADGSFSVQGVTTASCSFSYKVKNSQGTTSAAATVTVNFGSSVASKTGLNVIVQDAVSGNALTDYRWLVQEDLTFKADPSATPSPTTRTIGTSFHRSHMNVVASGCFGAKSCGSGQSIRVDDSTIDPATGTKGLRHVVSDAEALLRSVGLDKVAFDPTKNYYISILPGDALDDAGGHLMGGVAVSKATLANIANETLVIKTEATPVNPAQLSVFIYEDNNATNNQYDTGEKGLGGFNIIVVDAVGRSGDPAGQQTYDMFGMPLSNALLGLPGCPDLNPTNTAKQNLNAKIGDDGQNLVGAVYTCPNATPAEESAALAADLVLAADGSNTTNRDALALKYTLAGHALIKYLEPARYDIIAHPAAWRESAGERWWQVETLEGTPAQDAFVGTNEPRYFQEFGPPGFHTSIGFVNPDHVTAYGLSQGGVKAANDASHFSITGSITNQHMSRPSAVTLYDSGSYDLLSSTICQIVLNSGGGTGPAIAITECKPDGSFELTGIPNGDYELQIWDRWLDQIIQAQAVTVNGANVAKGNIPVLSWFTQHDQNQYLDLNGNGRYDDGEPGLANLLMTNRYRNGSISNQTLTDSSGNGILVELFPLFNWYVSEADTTRFKQTGVNVVVDAGGPTDATGPNAHLISSTYQAIKQGELGCNPDVTNHPELGTTACTADHTTDRVEIPGAYSYGNQGFISQRNRIDWGRAPYVTGENGGIVGTVVYSSTRPFDDQRFNIQNIWAPLVPRVTVNLYKRVTLADGTVSLTLVDTTKTTSWDDWVQTVIGSDGKQYMLDGDGITLRDLVTGNVVTGVTAGKQANIQCPGQRADDPFLQYTLAGQTAGAPDQFRCYDGFHVWNQVQGAPYDGHYQFPSAAYIAAHQSDLGSCSATVSIDGKTYRDPNKCKTLVSLPPGDYVVESITPDGYEVVKEEDKNIFTGDQFNGPAVQQFAGVGNVFILPDQATLNNDNPYNQRNADGVRINATTNLGNSTTAGYTTAMPECVGDLHRVPDYLTAFPGAQLVAPFSGMDRPLCDRKLVKLQDQSQVNANFFVFTHVPLAANGAGIILDDASSEFNAAAPDFGEKAAVPFVPVSVKDFKGVEIARVYADQWGAYNLMYPSSWTVNPPTPSGYLPNMLVNCMNDPGPIPERGANGALTGRMITDPQFNAAYSNFCYTLPFMPGQTTYLDTPVLPVAAFAQGNNPADCEYPDSSPAIRRVNSSAGFGPYLPVGGGTLTIDAVGDREVPNPSYAGPFAVGSPAAKRTLTRHYGFGTAKGTVKIGGVTLPAGQVGWNDQQIIVTVPAGTPSGQLVVTTSDGKSSVDGVTVTLEDKAPTRVDANGATGLTSIQAAIDAATPGDLILVNEGTYNELVVMWKPVRLQGTGGASVYVNATKYPTSKLETWRPVINAMFGVDINTGNNVVPAQVDALPTQEITGGVVLLEPSVLGSEEGAGITVLAKGLNDFTATATGLPLGTSNAECGRNASGGYDSVTLTLDRSNGANTVAKPGLSNFACAPSRIDGLGITGGDSGGGIYVNGWAHGLEIANNRVFGNAGAYNGGIRIGVPYLELEALPATTNGSGASAQIDGFGYDKNVKIHHNYVAKNGTVEAPVGAGGAGGGVSICTGTDGYSIDHNWVCGNYSASDGGGIGHIGYSQNGSITNNQILFNESTQQTAAVSGGGIAVVAEPILAGNLALGTGNVRIDANVVRGNLASGGKGGGIYLAGVNGLDVGGHPTNQALWFKATVTNNIVDNNVAGWAGGGISLFDTVLATVNNNTIASNDSVGVAGVVLSNGIGRPQPSGLVSQQNSTALRTAMGNALTPTQRAISSPTLINNIVWQNRSFYYGGNNQLCSGNAFPVGGTCKVLAEQTKTGQCDAANSAYWDLGVLDDLSTAPGATSLSPLTSVLTSINGYTANVLQTLPTTRTITHAAVALRVATLTTSVNHGFAVGQTVIVSGVSNASYNGTFTIAAILSPTTFTYTDTAFAITALNSINTTGSAVSNVTGPTSPNNSASDPLLADLYCNGSRITAEFPSVINPPVRKTIQVAATSDEGNNYVSVKYGPLSLSKPTDSTGTAYASFGNYHLLAGSPAIDTGTTLSGLTHDVDGDTRPQGAGYDRGADEATPQAAIADLAITLTDGVASVNAGGLVTYTITVSNPGAVAVTGASVTDTMPAALTGVSWTCAAGAGATCTTASGNGNIAGALVNLNVGASAVFTVKATVAVNATGTLVNTATVSAPASVTEPNTANNSATDTDAITPPPSAPTLTVLDAFNRANANNLGGNWTQFTLAGLASLRVNTNQAVANTAGNAVWTASFGAKQAAAFTIANATLANDALILKATGIALGVPTSYVRVSYTGGSVVVSTVTLLGGTTAIGTLTNANSTFANGDVLEAMVDANGLVSVWKNTLYVGAVQLPSVAAWTTGGGQIGILLPVNARVDNFAGGTLP